MLLWNTVENIDAEGEKNRVSYHIFSNFGEVTPLSIFDFAKSIANYNTIVAKTNRILYRANASPNNGTCNAEYETIQRYIKNGSIICSKLGITFDVREEQLHYEKSISWPHFRTGNFDLVYIITINITDKITMLKSAECIRKTFIKEKLMSLRSFCNEFYLHICDSRVVSDVACHFSQKIKEEICRGYRNVFSIEVKNTYISISIDDGWYDKTYYTFSEHELKNLSNQEQRIGFALCVLDKIAELFQNQPKVVFCKSRDENIVSVKNTFTIEPCSRNSEDADCFDIIFDETITKKSLQEWY